MNTDQLQRLGSYIVSRRTALGYKRRIAFAQAIGLSDRMLGDIEHGNRPAGAGSYAIIENGLLWRPGSISAILRGEEPLEVGDSPPYDFRLTEIDTDVLLGEIRRRIDDSAAQPRRSASEVLGPIGTLGNKSKRRRSSG